MEKNRSLRDQISKKDNEIADLSNPPLPSMNDLSQKLPGWISDDLRPLVYERGLEDKVMKLDKEYVKEDILEAFQLAHSEKSILREGVAKQSGGAEVVPSPQVMSLVLAIPVITSSLMSPMVLYSIFAFY
ncbi:hypothetical protein C1646_777277 [Rhizophagus diaphanus]|nr:hypothetical protein C1646_777277 [Rhizophagus diaphanus] [Rhizophagus sp. MUCL 43196]